MKGKTSRERLWIKGRGRQREGETGGEKGVGGTRERRDYGRKDWEEILGKERQS